MSAKHRKQQLLPTITQVVVDESKDIFLKKQWFITLNKETVMQKYSFSKKIGEGAFGQVYKATLIGTDLVRAIKVIKKKKVADPGRLTMEINLMKQLDHPNLVKLYETYQTENELYLVMEFCEGGELFDRIQHGRRMPQSDARQIFRDISKAINYLHSNNVCHRDLKPQNFLFLYQKSGSILKLTDFGLSTTVSETNNKLKSMVGTAYYISPQVLSSQYDISCDVWSMGVILIVLLTGCAPFAGQRDEQIINNVIKKNVIIPKNISPTVKNLIQRCLMCPNKRIKTSQILEHPWMIDKLRKTTINEKMDVKVLKKFSQAHRFKKMVLTIIASQVRSKDIEDIAQLFKTLNTKNDGVLSRQEIMIGLKRSKGIRQKQQDLMKIIDGIDTDKNGTISYTQFLAAIMNEKVYLNPIYLRIAFNFLDKNRNGEIELDEVRQLLMPQDQKNLQVQESSWNQMMKQIHHKQGDTINFQEFVRIISK